MDGNESLNVVPVGDRSPTRPDPPPSEFVRRVFTIVAVVAAAGLLVCLVWYAAGVLLLFFAAILLAILLRGLGDRLAGITGIPRGWALASTVAALGVSAALVGWLLESNIESQIDELAAQVSRGTRQAEAYLSQRAWGRRLQAHEGYVQRALSSKGLLGDVTGLVSSSLGGGVDLLVVLFLGIYLAIAPAGYVNGIVHLMPFDKRERTREVLASLRSTLGWWLVGRALSMAEVGLLTGLGLWLMGIPLPFTLGLLTGLMNFVPNIGPALATVITGLVGLSIGPMVAVYAVLAQILIGGFDGFVVTPLIQQRTISLPAGLILGSQVLIGVLLGSMGVVLATPLTAAVFVLVQKLYVRDVLGDPVAD